MLETEFLQAGNGKELQEKVGAFLHEKRIKREQIVSVSYKVETLGSLFCFGADKHNCYIIYESLA